MNDFVPAGTEPDARSTTRETPAGTTERTTDTEARSRNRRPRGEASGSGAQGERFRKVLARTIVLMNESVDRAQLISLAKASAVIGWEFPDVAWKTWLVVECDPPRIGLKAEPAGPSSLTVIMNSTVLAAAAAGQTSLGTAFITGKLQIRGMNPLFLAKFVKLVDPLLSGYRAALEEVHERAA